MEKNPKQFVEELGAMRARMVASMRENNAWEGFKRTLSDVYPDEAHFIFELLQNAEDAQASEVEFSLRQGGISVAHNGKRPFLEQDIVSITNIGESTKREDVNQIGKFGIGFKAVFAYTNAPRIESGRFAFSISDLFVPVWHEAAAECNGSTTIDIPFNGVKPASQCYADAEAWLGRIEDNTLLFLRHIRRISWRIDGVGNGFLERGEPAPGVISIRKKMTGAATDSESYWLRALKFVGSPSRYVALAFRLKASQNTRLLDPTQPLAEQMEIAPVDGQLSIYFPAEKETTKLKFHIHGPYAAPVDRASIKHSAENGALLQKTAELLVESLDTIKANGLLTVEFLDVLPNPDDALDPFYAPLLAEVVNAMRTRPLVPVDKGGFAAAQELLRGPAAIRSVLDADRLMFYTAIQGVKWAAGTMQNQRADKLLAALDIDEWGWTQLLERTDHLFSRTSLMASSERWLAEQTVEWLQGYYALLGELLKQRYSWGAISHIWDPKDTCKQWKIVRASDGKVLKGSEVYFAGERFDPADSMFPSTEKDLLTGTKKQQIERAEEFLELAGVRVLGERDRLQHMLSVFYGKGASFPAWDDHLSHLQRFIAEWERTKDAMMFKDAYLFLDESGRYFVQAGYAYLDAPVFSTGLKGFFNSKVWNGGTRYQVSGKYASAKIGRFKEFAQAAGIESSVPIRPAATWQNPAAATLRAAAGRETEYRIDEDFKIDGVDLTISDVGASRAIWSSISRADPKVLKARYRPNAQYNVKVCESQLVHQLRNAVWIPTKEGRFDRPCMVHREDLPDGFPYDDRNGWLTAIGFGSGLVRDPEEDKAIETAARTLGIAADIALEIDGLSAAERLEVERNIREAVERIKARKATGRVGQPSEIPTGHEPAANGGAQSDNSPLPDILDPVEALRSRFNRPGRTSLTSDIPDPGRVKDIGGYRKRVRQRYQERRKTEPQTKERVRAVTVNVWDPKNREVRDFFINEYRGRCQICSTTFPRRSDGLPYFEAVYLIPHSEAAWTDAPGSVICLCAQCSAKLQHGAVECADIIDQLTALRLESESGMAPTVRISLLGADVDIRISDRHLVEIQELLDTRSHESPQPAAEAEKESQSAANGLVQCPNCSAMVAPRNLERHKRRVHGNRASCGSSVVSWASTAKQGSASRVPKCRACGKPAVAGADYCYACG